MSTLIINGSPKGNRGNTEIFIREFMVGCPEPCQVRYAVQENPGELAAYLAEFDSVLFFMPMYVHAMSGIVMKLIEHMTPARPDQTIGFFMQYGFAEGAQAQYIKRYFELLARRLGYDYLGTVTNGNSAGVGMMPESMNKKLFRQLRELGRHYNETGRLSPEIAKQMEQPYHLSKAAAVGTEFMNRIGINKIFWHKMLRDNNAFDKRLDKPFSE